MSNLWVARDEPPFAAWTARLPYPTTAVAREHVLQVVNAILAAGIAHAVYDVRATRIPPGFHYMTDGTYTQFLARQHAAGERLTLFDLGDGVAPTPDGQLITPARLHYFDASGVLRKDEVADMGALLRNVRPADSDWGSTYMARVAPVTITSPGLAPIGTRGEHKRPVFPITISLFTDIWFPQVLALLDDKQPPAPEAPRRWFDNRTLATAHTLRLNHFLTTVQKAVLAADGTWEIAPAEGTARHYAAQVTDNGIRLDSPKTVSSYVDDDR